MANRTAYRWGAAILAVGIAAALAAMLRTGTVGAAPAAVAIDAALGVTVLSAALAMYGARGALGALGLVASSPHLMAWNGAVGASLAALAQLAVVHVLMRSVLDPSVQWALAAGCALAAALVGAVALGQSPATGAVALAVFSLLVIGLRTVTVAPAESRRRVVHGALAATALAWCVAGSIALVVGSVANFPAPEEFSRAPAVSMRPAAFAAPDAEAGPGRALPTAAVVAAAALAALRPWRRQRRYGDATWILGLICLALPLWFSADTPNAAAVLTPPLAMLAGACWDAWRPLWARRGATLIVIVQLAIVLVQWSLRSESAPGVPVIAATARGIEWP